MKDDVKRTEQKKNRFTGLAKKHSDLRGIVRFLAHRAAERTWKAMQHTEDSSPQKQGDSQ